MLVSGEELIQRIHNTPAQIVLAVAGGGSRAVGELLEVPGASRTVLEAVVPYSEAAMEAFLGGRPDRLCDQRTARAMAMVAYLRADRYGAADCPRAGVSCTASLATDRPKRGPHRAHLALQDAAQTLCWSVQLVKGRRSRKEEEIVVAALVLNLVAEACGVDDRLEANLLPEEKLQTTRTRAPQAWQHLLAGRIPAVRHGPAPEERARRVIFPGAFNPLHQGHRRMAQIAHSRLGQPVEFEISVLNVDKPPLDFREIELRLAQFSQDQTVWLTRAPTFVEKSAQFPGATFVVGSDTLARIADPRYYGDDPATCQAALETIAHRGCRFLVFGRRLGQRFLTGDDLPLPPVLAALCQSVPEAEFREDISSTELRTRTKH